MSMPTLDIQRTPLVAVYGTLKRGLCNHQWLTDADFLGMDSLTTIILYDLGPYPAAKAASSRGIEVEVFRVTAGVLRDLDRLEDHRVRTPTRGDYERVIHDTDFGPAWVYLYNHSVADLPAIRGGGWPPESGRARHTSLS